VNELFTFIESDLSQELDVAAIGSLNSASEHKTVLLNLKYRYNYLLNGA